MKTFRPLQKIRVLDLSRLIPGPFCSKILSDLGADVIKVEDRKGDDIASFPPFLFENESLLAIYFHKNKKRLRLDLTGHAGQKILQQLIKKADVLIASYRPHAMKKLGLDQKTLKRLNPKLICATVSGYGETGTLSHLAGHDLNFMAASGFLQEFLPKPESIPDASMLPLPLRYQFADFIGGGLFAAFFIVSALLERVQTKKGRFLNVPMAQALTYLSQHSFYADQDLKLGAITGDLARYRIYLSQDDKWLALAALEDKFWQRFCQALGHPEWLGADQDREKNQDVIRAVAKVLRERPSSHWMKLALKNDFCLSVISTREDLEKCGWLKKVKTTFEGQQILALESTLFEPKSKQTYFRSGHHNVSVLKELGYSAAQIQSLRKKGVIV